MTSTENRHFRKGQRAYILNEVNIPVYVGEGSGDLDYKDAIELSMLKRRNRGLPATKEFITIFAPPPQRRENGLEASQTSRASKNNPYSCVHCGYKTTRYGNMVTHLKNSHGDSSTDPRDNHPG